MQLFDTPSQSSAPSGPSAGMSFPSDGGGLPAPHGTNAGMSHLAQQLQSRGRGEDTMLVHMTPNEVNSLQGLAMAHGGSLTINPDTGLPEAGWLGKLLPTILGAALAATGVGAPLAAGIVGLGQTAITGDLKKGLMAGLGAFGGASLAGAAGIGSAISKNAFGALGDKAGILGAKMGAGTAAGTTAAKTAFLNAAAPKAIAAPAAAGAATPVAAGAAGAATPSAATSAFLNPAAPQFAAANAAPAVVAPAAKTGLAGFAQSFGDTAKAGLPGGMIGKAAPMLAGVGVMNSLSGAMTPSGSTVDPQSGAIDNSYTGPYYAEARPAKFAPTTEELLSSSKQRRYFDIAQPAIFNAQGQMVQPGSNTAPGTELWQPVANPKAKKGQDMYTWTPTMWKGSQMQQQMPGYAEGGKVHMDEGAFVMPARETAEFGNGSTEAGQRFLANLGGVPIRGQGDGVSDSISASIGGSTDARVADGEVLFQRPAVERIGRGDHKAGTKKLYSLMAKAEQSRKRAPRGGLNSLKVAAK